MAQNKPLLVVAFDIGTTFSGYAFSFLANKLKITTNKRWEDGGNSNRTSYKTPTSVLLTPMRRFHSFGYEAEDYYAALAERQEHKTWLMFRRFKMNLYNSTVGDSMELEAVSGQTHNALEIFAWSIGYLKGHFIRNVPGHVPIGRIHYVLTLPAIWKEEAKQFMRKAAIQGGLIGENLTIALEPEAASIFCKMFCVRQREGKNLNDSYEQDAGDAGDISKIGTRYIVVDAGGGTVDTTVHEVMYNGKLRELHAASGGAWGGTEVDDKFTELLMEIFSPKVMKEFGKTHYSDWLQLEKEFEVNKKQVSSEARRTYAFGLPLFLKEYSNNVRDSRLSWHVRFIGDKMRISGEIMQSLFRPTIKKIVTHIKTLLQDPRCKGVSHILLVGGFSESPFLQETIRMEFPRVNIVTPPDASLAVMEGAVIFGHVPGSIGIRVASFTYGKSIHTRFIEGFHDPSKREEIEGDILCRDKFDIFVTKDEEVMFGQETEEKIYVPARTGQTSVYSEVYCSTQTNPRYTTDSSCTKLGSFCIPMPDLTGEKKRKVGVTFVLGGTELKVKAHEKTTDKHFEATFEFATK